MKAKVRKGNDLLFPRPDFFEVYNGKMIINFCNKYTYKSFSQKENHLLIDTTEGVVDLVFTGETPKLEFAEFEKDQLILSVKR